MGPFEQSAMELPRHHRVANADTLVLVVVTVLGFDFTNGFHDTANAMATSVIVGVLLPPEACWGHTLIRLTV
jgi:hypothetical protein